ncbi:AroM family protein [Mesorhizobium sp. Z1-4]|uniref:AroM family protein n=1 Tax=Mesorhizobium sp. Z1-4 TaxID=2448478 RepID=UPI000FD8E8E6|nr:AroM family protein [Mesorhizobium sp. Z1-4]
MPPVLRIAFVTIGYSPRPDIVPEMVSDIIGGRSPECIEIAEFGVLDGLEGVALDAMKAAPGEPEFATRCFDGKEISVSVDRTERRLADLLSRVDTLGFNLIVLLCTGTRINPPANTPIIEAQRVVNSAIDALRAENIPLGILVPYQNQIESLFGQSSQAGNTRFVAASPYDSASLVSRVGSIADCKVTVMHCMGYSRAMRDELRAALPNHVLHARGLVASFVRQFL